MRSFRAMRWVRTNRSMVLVCVCVDFCWLFFSCLVLFFPFSILIRDEVKGRKQGKKRKRKE